ncbi:hypothetical protein [Methylocella sp.]|uniref:hypothetical protein n=1 Tax=Methylocella sp. TaxID=1978226 RepID=UPI0035AE14E9
MPSEFEQRIVRHVLEYALKNPQRYIIVSDRKKDYGYGERDVTKLVELISAMPQADIHSELFSTWGGRHYSYSLSTCWRVVVKWGRGRDVCIGRKSGGREAVAWALEQVEKEEAA